MLRTLSDEPGSFMMGSPNDEGGRDPGEVQHRVTLTEGFYLGMYEVTQGQWQAVMGMTPWAGKDYVSIPNQLAVCVVGRRAGVYQQAQRCCG